MTKCLTLFAFLTCVSQANSQPPIKVACVGNSITYGAGVANRAKNAYPVQLQALLGDDYEVRNFGVSGCTLLKKGDLPYWKEKAYREALDFKADIVLIKLGTNDSKRQNRVYLSDFEGDYEELIASFKKQNSEARVVLLLPVPSFMKDTTAIWNPVLNNKIRPLTQQAAYDTGTEVIDLYQLFVDDPSLLPDKIHPSSLGAGVMARRIYEQLTQQTEKGFDVEDKLGIRDVKRSSFHGYEHLDFDYEAAACKVVKPKYAANGRPWVWRARFWGHEPQTDIALLERGFHVVYCDVANLYGAPKAVERWDRFYALMQKAGLAEKAVLEGMSRGGLMVYNWATANPEKTACIYADAPVLDGASWPGGFGTGAGSRSHWERFRKEYRLSSKERKLGSIKASPINAVEQLVKANIPMIHVCGVADKVVPVSENTRLFETKIWKAGGEITTIYKDNAGHHPHSLANPSPVVDFILRALSRKVNYAAMPAPGAEYRSAAAWQDGKGWWAQAEDIHELCKTSGKIDLLLIGNSITQGWGGARRFTTYKPGQMAAEKHFEGMKWLNAGISGDRTEHVAWRLENGDYQRCHPDFVVLTIGVNNFPYNTAEEIAEGMALDLQLAKEKFPQSKILLFGALPTSLKPDTPRRKKYNELHQLIAPLGAQKQVHYSNLIDLFADELGRLNTDYYAADGVHLKPKGYAVWGEYIRKTIDNL